MTIPQGRHTMTTATRPAPLELTGGRWETKPGGVRVWVQQPDHEYIIKARQAEQPEPPDERWHVTGTVCDCGCLLRHPLELCPACVIPWCRAEEQRWNRTRRAA